jgi:D-arabinose 1-dehydrogenase-like Zn-dependent alcohol dehydrogenase
MVNLLELLYAATALCVGVTLYHALRKRPRAAKGWGIAAAAGVAGCGALALYLGGF